MLQPHATSDRLNFFTSFMLHCNEGKSQINIIIIITIIIIVIIIIIIIVLERKE